MPSLAESIWLDFGVHGYNIVLQEHQRPYSALRSLPFPEVQEPQLVSFIGHNVKTRVSRDAFGLGVSPGHTKILLHEPPRQKKSEPTILIADSGLYQAPHFHKTFTRGDTNQHIIRWHQDIAQAIDLKNLAHLVHTQILIPFSTVVCLFADDLGGLEGVAKLLASWLIVLSNRSLDLPLSTYARILILVEWEHPGDTFDERLVISDFNQTVRKYARALNQGLDRSGSYRMSASKFDRYLVQQFGDARVLPLPMLMEAKPSPMLNKLRSRIFHESNDIQRLRKSARVSFSARHLEAFFHHACQHFASSIATPFSFIQASRKTDPVSKDFVFHISNFLKMVPRHHTAVLSIPVIASALCLDAFPPGSHKFQPDSIFKTFYRSLVQDALQEASIESQACTKFEVMLESRFCQLALTSFSTFRNISAIHKETIKAFESSWKQLKSNVTCLSCLSRTPGNMLSCQHTFCDPCLMIYASIETQDTWRFIIHKCPLCQTTNQTSHSIKPYTAGVRALTIDGGDLESLDVLSKLEQSLGLPVKIREQFDIVNSSGIGGLIALELFGKDEQTVQECLDRLQKEKAFQSQRGHPEEKSRFSNVSTIFEEDMEMGWKQWMLVNQFKLPRWSERINQMDTLSYLKKRFSTRATMFNYDFGGAKFALTVKRRKDLAVCVFSNYNISEGIKNPISYIRSGSKNEIKLWKCAGISILSKPFLGYQRRESEASSDLINLTLHEQNDLWSRSGRNPDLLVATGTSVSHSTTLPWLQELRFKSSTNIQRAADAMLASLFYVELIGLPQLDEVGFYCRAVIRCRISPLSPAYYPLLDRLKGSKSRFYYDHKSIPCVERQTYTARNLPFSRYFEMSVLSVSDEIKVEIDGFTSQRRSISNCPYRVQQLIEDQGLNNVFGHRDHRTRKFRPSPILRRTSTYI